MSRAIVYAPSSAQAEALAVSDLPSRVGSLLRKISRAVRAEPKLYLFDLVQVPEGGARMENLVALHLLKACDFWTDSAQGDFSLHFIRSRDGQEVDFLVARDGNPWMLVEVKSNRESLSSTLVKYAATLHTELNFQLVTKSGFKKHYPDTRVTVISTETFLAGLV